MQSFAKKANINTFNFLQFGTHISNDIFPLTFVWTIIFIIGTLNIVVMFMIDLWL